MDLNDIVKEIKKKKELRTISDEFVLNLLKNELDKREYLYNIINKSRSIKELKRNEQFLYFFKEMRKLLHEIYGVFAPKDIKKMWNVIYSDIPLENKIIEVLKMSRPTKERLNFYPDIYEKIFNGKPESILDLASGINPPSIYFSKRSPINILI